MTSTYPPVIVGKLGMKEKKDKILALSNTYYTSLSNRQATHTRYRGKFGRKGRNRRERQGREDGGADLHGATVLISSVQSDGLCHGRG